MDGEMPCPTAACTIELKSVDKFLTRLVILSSHSFHYVDSPSGGAFTPPDEYRSSTGSVPRGRTAESGSCAAHIRGSCKSAGRLPTRRRTPADGVVNRRGSPIRARRVRTSG